MKIFTARLPVLCRGDSEAIDRWLGEQSGQWILFCMLTIAVCSGLYGATIGLWRAGLMALYVALKFPLLIFLTTLCNGTLNWMLAAAMGTGFTFRQTLLAQLMSFTVASLCLAALAPITLFILLNTPSLMSGNTFGHSFFLLINVGALAFAGIVANIRLHQFLLRKTGQRILAQKVLLAWLAGNLLVGAQLSWNLRPFIGSPGLAIQFLRPDPFNGNFYESVYRSALRFATEPRP
ncbi:hypothetical protein PDESU_05654 [Pontiella desulfatans]|uniref:Uncharacterized protein n=1 Tax=Pontiella desulfatans TaxID=2750659 RepID=A0A6C2UAI3_PONDE|nr:hypothetical protein [Pontiella desulfatans]VGO17060.1 hypothetical protein PDESU_05654 [Pontiella desulfatans]